MTNSQSGWTKTATSVFKVGDMRQKLVFRLLVTLSYKIASGSRDGQVRFRDT